MGAADYPLAPPQPEDVPVLSKLQDYGYAEDTETPILLAPILESMDAKGLWLLERLVSDLADFSETTQSLRDTVSELTAQLEQEKQTTQRLKAENARLSEENARIRVQMEETHGKHPFLTGSSRAEEEEQLRQWQTQSLHQLQELERMNQALRAALSRHTCGVPSLPTASTTDVPGKEKLCGGYIVLSQALAPPGTPLSTANESKTVSLEQISHPNRITEEYQGTKQHNVAVVEDKHSDIQKLLMETQEELSAKNQEIERLFSLVEASAKMLQTVNESGKEREEAKSSVEISKDIASMDNRKMAHVELQLERLHNILEEKESLIAGLQSQLSQKVEELSFITDEKVVVEEALSASQFECEHLSGLIKDMDGRLEELNLTLQTRTRERDTAIIAENQTMESKQLAEESLQKKCDVLL